MAHKSKDTRKLEEYCETAGLTKQYCKMIGEISLRYYRYAWLPSLKMEETADTLPVLRDAVFTICDRSIPYPKDRLVRSVRTISRLDLFDVLVERALEFVWEDILTDPEEVYAEILRYCYLDRTQESEYDFCDRTGLSRSAMYEGRSSLLIAVGLAMNGCAAPTALRALGEWG